MSVRDTVFPFVLAECLNYVMNIIFKTYITLRIKNAGCGEFGLCFYFLCFVGFAIRCTLCYNYFMSVLH